MPVEIGKRVNVSFSIPPPHAHAHRLELKEAEASGSFSGLSRHRISILIGAYPAVGGGKRELD